VKFSPYNEVYAERMAQATSETTEDSLYISSGNDLALV
jgi:hypothetical protein